MPLLAIVALNAAVESSTAPPSLTTGLPAAFQAVMPPCKLTTSLKPCSFNQTAACPLLPPAAQYTKRVLFLSKYLTRSSNWALLVQSASITFFK